MKKLFTSIILSSALFSCGIEQPESIVSMEMIEIAIPDTISQIYTLESENSTVAWQGFMPTKEHFGVVNLSSGSINILENEIVGGKFVVDLSTITVKDLSGEDAKKLEKHLKSKDFFEIDIYPNSIFNVASVSANGWGAFPYTMMGNLTIKDITRAVAFNFDYIMRDSLIFAVTEPINLNRTDWGVNYKSATIFDDIKDELIYDNIEIQIKALFELKK